MRAAYEAGISDAWAQFDGVLTEVNAGRVLSGEALNGTWVAPPIIRAL